MILHYTHTSPENASLREAVLSLPGISKNMLPKLKHGKKITVNGKHLWYDYTLKAGDQIELDTAISEEAIYFKGLSPVAVLYEDDNYLVLNKKPGLTVHPSLYHYEDNLLCHGASYLASKNEKPYLHCMTRLDRETSGAVLFAKSVWSCNMLKKSTFQKHYIGITDKPLAAESGEINLPILRPDDNSMLRAVDDNGKPSLTRYTLLCQNEKLFFYHFIPVTGRTHQIRVHASASGAPLVGDRPYGSTVGFNRAALHCAGFCFASQVDGTPINAHAPLPDDIKKIIPLNHSEKVDDIIKKQVQQ